MKKTTIEEIYSLIAEDRVLLPLRSKSKIPALKNWPKITVEQSHKSKYREYLRSASNIGVSLGKISNGLCSIDIDSDDEAKAFLELNPGLVHSLRTKGKRGENIWIQVVGDFPPLTKLSRNGDAWGEWRADGGQTVICGVHPEGGRYTFIVESKPVEVRYEEIKWPTGIDFPPSSSNSARHSSASSLVLQDSESSLNSADSMLLQDSEKEAKAARSQKRLRAFATRNAFESKFGAKVTKVYDERVGQIFEPEQGKRNKAIVDMIPFLIRCVGENLVFEFAMLFYDENQLKWTDSREQHEKEVRNHLKNCLASYRDDLTEEEREVYDAIANEKSAAFRIIRDLCKRPEPSPFGFCFLSHAELGARLNVDGTVAGRILRQFCSNEVIEISKKGKQRKKGKLGVATVYRWML